jgi:competence protein ComGC
MKTTTNFTQKTQGSIVEFLIVVVIVVILMRLLLGFFLSQQTKITNTAFVALAQSFTSKVNIVHGQWVMDGQPNVVILSQLNSKKKQYIHVNSAGWIDSNHTRLACHIIWQQTLAIPLEVVNSIVSVIEIHHKDIKGGRLCRYTMINGQYFDYRSDTGKVKQVSSFENE